MARLVQIHFTAVIIVLFATDMARCQQETLPLPEIWKPIHREVQAIVGAAQDPEDTDALRRQLQDRAVMIADRYDEQDIMRLFESADEAWKRIPNSLERWGAVYLSIVIIVQRADPEDQHGMKSVLTKWRHSLDQSWHGFAIAGIDLFHDDSSQAWLLKLALEDGADERRWRHDRGGVAMQLLRGYAAEGPRPRLEAALRTEPAEQNPRTKDYSRGAYLRAALSSMDYATGLPDPQRRARDAQFQSDLWRVIAFGPKGFRSSWGASRAAAELFERHWQAGDEPFLLRIFQDPASTSAETLVAVYLAHLLPDDAKQTLQQIADSDSPKARLARHALDIAAKRK